MAENTGPQNTATTAQPSESWAQSLCATKDRLVLLPQNPAAMFVYWEWTAQRTALFEKGSLAPVVRLKLVYAENRAPALEQELDWKQLHAYVPPPEPGRYYQAFLQVNNSEGQVQTALESNVILSPRGKPAGDAPSLPSSGERLRSSMWL